MDPRNERASKSHIRLASSLLSITRALGRGQGEGRVRVGEGRVRGGRKEGEGKVKGR